MPDPGELRTEPSNRVVFNSPFLSVQKSQIRLSNNSDNRVAWIIKSTNLERLHVTPTCGTLSPGEQVLLEINCQPFDYKAKRLSNDRLTIEWLDTPDDDAEFKRDWFLSSGVLRRKVMPVTYNI